MIISPDNKKILILNIFIVGYLHKIIQQEQLFYHSIYRSYMREPYFKKTEYSQEVFNVHWLKFELGFFIFLQFYLLLFAVLITEPWHWRSNFFTLFEPMNCFYVLQANLNILPSLGEINKSLLNFRHSKTIEWAIFKLYRALLLVYGCSFSLLLASS